MFEVTEGDKLDDVSEDRLSSGRSQDPVITIQHLHVAEVGIPDPDDDDRHGEVGGLDDSLPRVGHVGDDTVCQDQQDEVLLQDTEYKNTFLPLHSSVTSIRKSKDVKVGALPGR